MDTRNPPAGAGQLDTAADVLTVEAAALLCECSPVTYEDKLRAGLLPGVKVGTGWIVPRQALIEVLNRQALANVKKAEPPAAAAPAPKPAAPVLSMPRQAPKSARQARRNTPPVLPAFPGQENGSI